MKSKNSKAIVIACLPYLLALMFFYSLAIHMHMALGGWPERIGTEGFPPALLMHADIQGAYMSGLFFFHRFCRPGSSPDMSAGSNAEAFGRLFRASGTGLAGVPWPDVSCAERICALVVGLIV